MGHGKSIAGSVFLTCVLAATATTAAHAAEGPGAEPGPTISITLPGAETGIVDPGGLDGRIYAIIAPRGQDPLDEAGDVTGSTIIYGQNVDGVHAGDVITLSGGGAQVSDTGVYGWPHESLADLPAGEYTVRPFLNIYESVTRSDGSTVKVHFPCGDGGWFWDTPGNLVGEATDVTVTGEDQDIALNLDGVNPTPDTSHEIGGCQQGNYADTDTVKHLKIRSARLSEFWGRDVFIGANITLPPGYDAGDEETRYPVIYNQGHWPGGRGAYGNRQVNGFLTVTIRQESPFYDDAYGVNSSNVGPWGDAIAEELIPAIDNAFNTINQPYARVVDGGSTGGWVSLASLVFRPDIFGSAWSYYPDSLDFHAHQQINLYAGGNAYFAEDGEPLGSWRTFNGDTEQVTVTMPAENKMELALGTGSRSFDQWDIWNAVYGVQGFNGYPLDPWDKQTGEIDTDTAQLWKPMDLTDYVRSNWSTRNLGQVLQGRVHVSVGSHDNYYLNGGVELFKQTVEELGGPQWADVTVIPGATHGGYYNGLTFKDYMAQIDQWVRDHAPDGAQPLEDVQTVASARGNEFSEVLAHGGAAAAQARQSDPVVSTPEGAAGDVVDPGGDLTATFGTWDPAMHVSGQWLVDGLAVGDPVVPTDDSGNPLTRSALADTTVTRAVTESDAGSTIQFAVTGTKRGYEAETRTSSAVRISPTPVTPTPTPGPTDSVPTPAPTATLPAGSGGQASAHADGGEHSLAATGASQIAGVLLAGAVSLIGGAVLVASRHRSRQ